MAFITVGEGSGLVKLAPDLTYPSSLNGSSPHILVTGIDASSGLTNLLNLSGKYIVSALYILDLTAESITVKLTVDGVIVWNDTFVTSTILSLLSPSYNSESHPSYGPAIRCDSSFLLQLQTTSDADVSFRYLAMPIL